MTLNTSQYQNIPHMTTTKEPTIKIALDMGMMKIAEEAVTKSADHTIGLEHAKAIFTAAKDGGKYTDAEKATIRYIREKHAWTAEADAWYRSEVSKWAAHK